MSAKATSKPSFFWFNGQKISNRGIRLPARIEKAIRQKHDHEGEGHEPLWLIWLDRKDHDGIRLNAVANSIDAARYGAFIVIDQGEVWVERIPANHGFASSIQSKMAEAVHASARAQIRIAGYYRRAGD